MTLTGKRFYRTLIAFTIFMFLLIESSIACNCTLNERSYKQVLSRKKRFLIFPKGANIINTCYFGKQIVAGFPRGFNWILELDIFWPLPFESRVFSQAKDLLFGKNKVKPLIPPWLVEPKKPSYSTYNLFLTPKPTKPIHFIEDHHFEHTAPESWHHDGKQPDLFVPESGWKDDVIQNIKNQIDIKHRSWSPSNISTYNYMDPNFWTKYNQLGHKNKFSNKNQYYYPRGRSMRVNEEQETLNNIDVDSRWDNIYAQKDRQDLYQIIHAGFKKIGIDTKSCIQRTICEVKHFLLPSGKSLLHDVFRLIFTYPLHLEDEWAQAARANKDECSQKYGKECPMSILDFMLHSGKIF